MAAKGIVKGIVTAAVICGIGAGGWAAYRHFGGSGSSRSEKVFVQKVAVINTVNGANLFATDFAGVIVAQKTVDVKYDMSKTVEEVLVNEGDSVKKGDKLLTYNVEAIQLDIDTAKLDVERMQNQIQTNEAEIAQLEQEKRTATGDAQVSYTTQILALQSENARSEYDIKAKNVEITKLESTLNNAFVTAPISGTVKDLKDVSNQDMYMENPEVLLKISADGDYRVKGVFNEQNGAQVYQGAKVYLKSRVDDTEWRGEISEIDTSPQTDNNNMYYYYGSDDQTSSSKYAFYVEPESLDGFMLGQHVLIEMDNGQEDADRKEGIWLYSDFILWDGDRNYVWAQNARGQIEKRYVEVGDVNDEYGDCKIVSGLELEDYIAFPADYIEAGMGTTTNQSDEDIPDNVLGDSMGGGMYGGGGFYDDGDENFDENVSYDAMGNMVYTDDEGNVYIFDAEGNVIGDGEGYFEDEEDGDEKKDDDEEAGDDPDDDAEDSSDDDDASDGE